MLIPVKDILTLPSASTATCTSIRSGAIRLRTAEPDYYSSLPDKHYELEHSVYEGAEELLPSDTPKPLGKPVVMTTYVDANLYHDFVNGRSDTGVLHLFNQICCRLVLQEAGYG